jgi:hypothetical protein
MTKRGGENLMNLNEMNFASYISNSILIVPIILGIVQAIKMTKVPDKYAPVISVVVGVLLAFVTSGGETWGHSTIAGVIYGLSASGLYSGAKTVTGR